MAKLNAFLTNLSKKLKFDLTDEKYKDILASEQDIPDDLVDAFERGFMTEDAAVNNTKIKNRIRAEVYNGMDTEFENSLDDFNLPEDVRTGIVGEKKTVDRVKKLVAHLKGEAEKAAKSGNKSDADALRTQIQDLNNQLKAAQAAHKTEADQLRADNENNLMGYQLRGSLGTRKFSLPEQMDLDEKVEMVHGILGAAMSKDGYKLIRQDNKLRLVKADGSEAYDDKNNPIELNSYVDSTLSKRGLLQVSDPAKGQQGNDTPTHVSGGGNTVPASFQNVLSEIDRQISEAQAGD